MPRHKLTDKYIQGLQPKDIPYEVAHKDLPKLLVRVQPKTGVKSYIVQFARGVRQTLENHPPAYKLEAAVKEAEKLIGEYGKTGEAKNPRSKKKHGTPGTLAAFLDDEYGPWAKAHQKDGERSTARLRAAFKKFLNKKFNNEAINARVIDRWRTDRLGAGKAAGTVNRELAGLKAALSKAVEWGILTEHPLDSVKLRRVDNERVRYFEGDEEERLRNALIKRDADGVEARKRGNAWRTERGYALLSELQDGDFCDHLSPMTLVSMNTGLRRGELTALDWTDINFEKRDIFVRASTTKSSKSRHVAMNSEVVAVLTKWKGQGDGTGRVFAVRDVKKSWAGVLAEAKIENLRWHDLRHVFGSKAVMAGVDLNVVRELMGHQSLAMTLRYSHLAPAAKHDAVERIVRKPASPEPAKPAPKPRKRARK